jgi:sulfonate transport system substrate-binding protein
VAQESISASCTPSRKKVEETGKWVKVQPKEAAKILAGIWGIDAATVEEANSHRSYKVGVVTKDGLAEQIKIADTFRRRSNPGQC